MRIIVCVCEWGYGDMGAGLQVFSESGGAVVTESDTIGKFLGGFDALGTNGSITDARLEGMRLWVAVTKGVTLITPTDAGREIPEIVRSGNTISWVYTSIRRSKISFVYGVY